MREQVEMLISIIEGAGFEVRSYSGRAMYGDECVGFTFDGEDSRAIAELIESTQGDYEQVMELANALRNSRTDSMGRSAIMYFPTYQMEVDDETA